MTASDDREQIDEVIASFFEAFDNRNNRVPLLEKLTGLFARALSSRVTRGHVASTTQFWISPSLVWSCLQAESSLSSTSGRQSLQPRSWDSLQ